jgi:hypothetical protein
MLLCVAEQSKHKRMPMGDLNRIETNRTTRLSVKVLENRKVDGTGHHAHVQHAYTIEARAISLHPNTNGKNNGNMPVSLTVRHRCPGRTGGRTVETNLVGFNCLNFLKLLVLVLCGNADFAISSGGEGSIVSQVS